MRLIAKRGQFSGPNKQTENTKAQIQLALSKGYDVELDVILTDNGLFLGHDGPKERLLYDGFLDGPKIWTHCKSRRTYDHLIKSPFIKAFCHEEEDLAYINQMQFKWNHARLGKNVYQKTDSGWKKVGLYRDNFQLLNVFCDVDGVMAKNKVYDRDHNCISKEFNDKDFTALKRFKALGLNIVLISGDEWNAGMAQKRGLSFIHTNTIGENSKLNTLRKLNIDLESSLYIGDDRYDCELLNFVGFPFCPNDAIKEVKNESIVLGRASGEGVLAEMYDWLVQRGIIENILPTEP